MRYIVSSIHNPVALAVTCQRLNLPTPTEGCVHLGDQEVSGWIVRLPGVRFPVVCNTLTGLIAYHPIDNAFGRYARVMRFIHRYYEIHARLRQSASGHNVSKTLARKDRHSTLSAVGA